MRSKSPSGLIAWFIENPIAANLLMALILFAGVSAASGMRTEGFPTLSSSSIQVSVEYESGSASETERSVSRKIEQALSGVAGIKRISSISSATMALVTIQKTTGYDLDKLLNNVKSRVDSLSLPGNAERPSISRGQWREDVAYLEIFGPVEQDVLSKLAQRLKQRLIDDPAIPAVSIVGEPKPEVTIEIDEATLQRYQLTLADVVARVRAFAAISNQASLRGDNSRIVLKADKQATNLNDLGSIQLVSGQNGQLVRLGDVAAIVDGYTDDATLFRYNGQPAIRLSVQMLGKADLIPAARRVRELAEEINAGGQLPEGVSLQLWNDTSEYISGRLTLMAKNGLMGMALVLVVLALFLNLRIAFWVAMGLPISFAGALVLMGGSFMDLTLNDMTTFGFIIAIGIVVDDAIVVAESIHSSVEEKGRNNAAVLSGVRKVAVPTILGVLTTIAAFFPITTVEGELAEMFALFAWVVIFALVFSIIESKLILPAHLAHIRANLTPGRLMSVWGRIQMAVSAGMRRFTQKFYRPVLRVLLRLRYLTLAVVLAVFLSSIWIVESGYVRVVFFPDIPSDVLVVTYVAQPDLGPGPLFSEAKRIEARGRELAEAFHQEEGGEQSPIRGIELNITENEAVITASLANRSERAVSVFEIADRWREAVGSVEGAQSISFAATLESFPEFSVSLAIDDPDLLAQVREAAAADLRKQMGVIGVKSSLKAARGRIQVELTELGRSLGFSRSDVAQQISHALDGAEVQRFFRVENEVKTKVRYPKADRRSLSDLDEMYVRTPTGQPVLLGSVATFRTDFTVDEILRIGGKQVVTLVADIDKSVTTGSVLSSYFNQTLLPQLQADFPGLTAQFDGEVEQEGAAIVDFLKALAITMLAIYALLAVPLKSYSQPLIILSAIPFGIVGAIFGHLVNGFPISILSIMGVLALCGVVVNDSLLLVSTFNKLRESSHSILDAVIETGCLRMRAVVLTSATTFVGLAPLISETSEQAQFLIPAAVSLGYGILFATVITLVLVPVLLMIQHDIGAVVTSLRRYLRRRQADEPEFIWRKSHE